MPTNDDRHQSVLRAILLEHKAAVAWLSPDTKGRDKRDAHREWTRCVKEVSRLLKE